MAEFRFDSEEAVGLVDGSGAVVIGAGLRLLAFSGAGVWLVDFFLDLEQYATVLMIAAIGMTTASNMVSPK